MTIADQTIQAREGEELDAAVIARYLKPHLPHLTGEPTIRQFLAVRQISPIYSLILSKI